MKWIDGDFEIDTETTRLDVEVIQSFLNDESYWANERTRQQTEVAIENSICFGVYFKDRQIGFARVVSDKSTFAYLGDVFILSDFQGSGVGKFLMASVISHPELQGLRRWILATRDAHKFYQPFGFRTLVHPERWMELPAPNAY